MKTIQEASSSATDEQNKTPAILQNIKLWYENLDNPNINIDLKKHFRSFEHFLQTLKNSLIDPHYHKVIVEAEYQDKTQLYTFFSKLGLKQTKIDDKRLVNLSRDTESPNGFSGIFFPHTKNPNVFTHTKNPNGKGDFKKITEAIIQKNPTKLAIESEKHHTFVQYLFPTIEPSRAQYEHGFGGIFSSNPQNLSNKHELAMSSAQVDKCSFKLDSSMLKKAKAVYPIIQYTKCLIENEEHRNLHFRLCSSLIVAWGFKVKENNTEKIKENNTEKIELTLREDFDKKNFVFIKTRDHNYLRLSRMLNSDLDMLKIANREYLIKELLDPSQQDAAKTNTHNSQLQDGAKTNTHNALLTYIHKEKNLAKFCARLLANAKFHVAVFNYLANTYEGEINIYNKYNSEYGKTPFNICNTNSMTINGILQSFKTADCVDFNEEYDKAINEQNEFFKCFESERKHDLKRKKSHDSTESLTKTDSDCTEDTVVFDIGNIKTKKGQKKSKKTVEKEKSNQTRKHTALTLAGGGTYNDYTPITITTDKNLAPTPTIANNQENRNAHQQKPSQQNNTLTFSRNHLEHLNPSDGNNKQESKHETKAGKVKIFFAVLIIALILPALILTFCILILEKNISKDVERPVESSILDIWDFFLLSDKDEQKTK